MHILVVGSGSVGKRHARNLQIKNCTISAVDPREDRLKEIAEGVTLRSCFADIESALSSGEHFDGVVIGSPPSAHVSQAIVALEARVPVLLEKPVALTLSDAEYLNETLLNATAPLLLGYTWRWWPPLREVKRLLSQDTIGQIHHAKFVMSAHLADWHPWERYQDFFMSKKALGGGALLDESHWIDLMLWFFGEPKSVFAAVEKITPLEIDTDDNVDILIRYENGLRVNMHLDLYGRPHEKYIQFTGSAGTIKWSEKPNQVAINKGGEKGWINSIYDCERNDMFVGVIDTFLNSINGMENKVCTLSDGLSVLKIVEAARISDQLGRRVDLSEIAV